MHFLFGVSGRLGRLGWWAGQLIGAAVGMAGLVAAAYMLQQIGAKAAEPPESFWDPRNPFLAFLGGFLLSLWIAVATSVRRLHDLSRSGWVILGRVVLAVILSIVATILMVMNGWMDLLTALLAPPTPQQDLQHYFGVRDSILQQSPTAFIMLLFLPFAPGLYHLLQLGFMPGHPGENRYAQRRSAFRSGEDDSEEPAGRGATRAREARIGELKAAQATAQAAKEHGVSDYMADRARRWEQAGPRRRFGRRGEA